MTLTFEHAIWAWVAAVVLLVAGAMALIQRRSWRWRIAAVLLPQAAAALMALALARPHVSVLSNGGVVILLDLSESTRVSPWRDAAWVRKLATERLGPSEQVTVVGFDGRSRLLLDRVKPGDAPAWPVEWPLAASVEGSNLAAALAWRTADEMRRGQILSPRWVITDGLLAANHQDAAFPIAWTILPPDTLDAGIGDFEVRPAIGADAGSRLDILTQVRVAGTLSHASDRTLHVIVHIKRDGEMIAEQHVVFAADADQSHIDASRWISVPDPLPGTALKKSHRYAAAISLASPDPWPENDVATVLWTPPGERRVLVIGTDSAEGTAAASAAPPREATFMRTDAFTASAGQLASEGWQVIVLDNVPVEGADAPVLSAASAQALDRFVRESGGGLLILGRGQAFGPGHYGEGSAAGDFIENLSPVWSHPHTGKNLHVVFLLDASASMGEPAGEEGTLKGGAAPELKFKLLAQGVDRAVHLLSTGDRVTAITFNDHAELLMDRAPREAEATLRDELARVSPAGATAPDAALSLVADAFRKDATTQQLLVLVTDGEIPTMDVERWKATLQSQGVNQKQVAFAIIAPHSGGGTLDHLATTIPGTTWLPTDDPHIWSALLQRAIAEYVNGRAHVSPVAWQATSAAEFSAVGRAPEWTTVWLKAGATLLAQGGSGEGAPPFAAIVQRGLGQCAALAMSGDSAPGYSSLMAHLLERLSAPPGDRRFALAAARDPVGGWRISADGAEGDHFLDGEFLDAHILNADSSAEPITIHLDQHGPGHYEAHIRENAAHGLTATVFRRDGSRELLLGTICMPVLETEEWPASVDQPLNAARLPASATELSADFADHAQWNPPTLAAIELAPAFWGASIIAALAALWSRR